MTKEVLQIARALIEQKRYEEARRELLAIQDNPTAQAWLAKIAELSAAPVRLPTQTMPALSEVFGTVDQVGTVLQALSLLAVIAGGATPFVVGSSVNFVASVVAGLVAGVALYFVGSVLVIQVHKARNIEDLRNLARLERLERLD